jgi:hypothetical protein
MTSKVLIYRVFRAAWMLGAGLEGYYPEEA